MSEDMKFVELMKSIFGNRVVEYFTTQSGEVVEKTKSSEPELAYYGDTLCEVKKPSVTTEMIAQRAYEISQSPEAGSDHDNWVRAEKELMRI